MPLQLILNGIIAGSIYALIALGFTVIYRTVKIFHFAHGIIYTSGAYIAYALIIYFHLPIILSFIVAVLFSSLLGMAIEKTTYLPLRKKKSPPLVFMIASFGIFIFLQNLLALLFGNQILTIDTGPIKEGHSVLGAVITDNQILILAVSIILMLMLWIFIEKTKFGKAIRAVSDDQIASSIMGINPNLIILVVFAIGSAIAGAAGILISFETNIEPTMGFTAFLKGIIAAIIGGMGSIPGAVLGGFFLGLVENLGIWKIQAGWKDTISFIVLIIFLLFRPGGIFNVRSDREDS